MDRQVVDQKLESLRRCIVRIRERCPLDAATLGADPDAQDIVTLNLTRAVQMSVDIGAHLLAGYEVPPPDTMGETFDRLRDVGVLDDALARRMKCAVGFRNIAVHSYEAINWEIVYAICSEHLADFEAFARAVLAARR